jgi:hypothetical protein
VVRSGTTPNFTYKCRPLFLANGDAAELPYFSFVEQIRPGSGVVLDRMAIGCALESWQLTVGSGSGRANSKINVEFVGSGKVIDSATGITVPAAKADKLLPSASLTLTINGVDHFTNVNIVSLEAGWKNNLRMDAGFFRGSGFQAAGDGSSGAIRGRLEFGNRQGNLKFVARFENGSTEHTKLKAQITGMAVVNLSFDTNAPCGSPGRRSPMRPPNSPGPMASSPWPSTARHSMTRPTASSPPWLSARWMESASNPMARCRRIPLART